MKIDRNNYELCFIDYLDGKLNPAQVARLMEFLADNPDLNQELMDVREVVLSAPSISFPGKSHLKKDENEIPAFDHQCVAFIEGDMQGDEKGSFLKSITASPVLDKIFRTYSGLKLNPDLSITYPGKASLKKPAERNIVVRYLYPVLAVAAAVVLVMIIYRNTGDNAINTQGLALSLGKSHHSGPADINRSNNQVNVPEQFPDQQFRVPVNNVAYQPERRNNPDTNSVSREQQQIIPQNEPVIAYQPDSTPAANQLPVSAVADNHSVEPREFKVYNRYQYISGMLEQVDKDNVVADNAHRPSKLSLWTLADIGVKGFNLLTGNNVKLKKQYNDKGEVEALALNSSGFEFSTPVK
jgi:hypothetical protein